MDEQHPFFDSVRAGLRADGNPSQPPAPERGPVMPPVTVAAPEPPVAAASPPVARTGSRRTGMLLLAAAVIVIQLGVVGAWLGSGMRTEALATLDDTLAKLSVIEDHGHDVRAYYTRIRENADALRNPLAAALPFAVSSVHAEVRQVDSEVTARFGQVLAEQRAQLGERIDGLSELLDRVAGYEYDSRDAILAEIARMRTAVADGSIDVSQLSEFGTRLDEIEQTTALGLRQERDRAFGELENSYSVAVNFNYPSRTVIETYIAANGSRTRAGEPDLTDTVAALETIARHTETLRTEVEAEKRQLIFTNITNTTKEVDSLLAFFTARSGYLTEISQLNRYKDNVTAFQPTRFTETTAAEMQKRVERELFSLVEQPRASRIVAEEKERQELLARQKKLQEENGIPVPPLNVSKLIYVDLAKQRLYAYENGMSIFAEPVPVTTGKRGFETVTGQYTILQKFSPFRMRSPFPGIYYDNPVDFFMPFYQGYGFHDASWRTVYGTPDFLEVGSHGCINTPYVYVKQLYYWSEIGTTVLVR